MSDAVPDTMDPPFPCNGCGLCCEQVHRSPETAFLDGGNGSCRNFDAASRHCTIYAKRPDICRVDQQYVLRFHAQCTWDEFVAINTRACRQLAERHEAVAL